MIEELFKQAKSLAHDMELQVGDIETEVNARIGELYKENTLIQDRLEEKEKTIGEQLAQINELYDVINPLKNEIASKQKTIDGLKEVINQKDEEICDLLEKLGAYGNAEPEPIPSEPVGTSIAQLSQHGITWHFEGLPECGEFANGDKWVVGPVTITSIDPPCTIDDAGRTINGSMINPLPINNQGFDSIMKTFPKPYAGNYDAGLNVGLSMPLVVDPGSSLVCSKSRPFEDMSHKNDYNGGYDKFPKVCLQTAAVLTVLDKAPPAGSFRPPYCGTDKSIRFNVSDIDWGFLQALPVTNEIAAVAPSIETLERYFERPWLDFVPDWDGDYLHPLDNMTDYGARMAEQIGDALLALCLNLNVDKKPLAIRMIQLGVALWGIAEAGGYWPSNGAVCHGRLMPILFASKMLDYPPLSGPLDWNLPHDPEKSIFQEIDQTFYIEQEHIDKYGYPQSMLGFPEWKQKGSLITPAWNSTQTQYPNYIASDYRDAFSQTILPHVLSAYILGIALPSALCDYIDLWAKKAPTYNDSKDRPVAIAASKLAVAMWKTYR